MDWLSDAWSGIKSFFGGGNDDEKRRREEEARRRAAEQRQREQQKQSSPLQLGGLNNTRQQQSPFNPQQQSPLQMFNQQEDKRPTAENPFMLNLNKKPEPTNKIQPQDRELIKNISGYYVMTPQAQQQALQKARTQKAVQNRVAKPTKEQQEAAKAAERKKEIDTVVKQFGDTKLQNGKTINNVIRDYNSSDAWGQARIRKDLENRAASSITNGNQARQADRDQAGILLAVLEDRGKNQFNLLQAGTGFVSDLVGATVNQGVNTAQGLRSAFGGGNELDDLRQDFQAGRISEKEYLDRANAVNRRMAEMTGSLSGEDKGMADRLIRSIGNAADLAAFVPLVGAGARGVSVGTKGGRTVASQMARDAAENAAFGSLGALREGTDTTLEGIATEATIGGVLGGGISGAGSAISKIRSLRGAEREAAIANLERQGIPREDIDAALNDPGFTPEQQARIDEANATYAAQNEGRLPAGVSADNLPVVSVVRNDGSLEMYQPKTPAEFNRYNEFIDGAHAGKRDVNGDVWHISSGNTIHEAGNYKQLDKAPEITVPDPNSLEGIQRMLAQADEVEEVIPQVQEQASRQAEGGSSRGINAEEIMERYRDRNRVYNEADPATRAEINERAASQVNADDVTFDSPWGREAVWSDLVNLLGEADARTLSNRYGMSAQEWRAVMNATGDVSRARNLAALFDSQIRKVLGKERVQGAQTTRAAEPRVDEPTARTDEPDFSHPDWQATEGGFVNTRTGEMVDVDPNYGRGTSPDDVPPASDPPTNPFEANMRQREEYIRGVMEEVDAVLKDSGSSYAQLHRKIQVADRTGDAPQLTQTEAGAYAAIRTELDSVLDDMIARGEVSPDVGRREWYLPQQVQGTVNIPRTAEELYDTRFGYDQKRTGVIDIDDLDSSFDPTIDYYVKGTPDAAKNTIYNDIVEANPNLHPEAATQITELKYNRITETNKIAREANADPRKIDSLTDLGREAELEGRQRVQDNSNYGAMDWNSRDRLRSIESDQRGKSLYDSGFDQYRFAHAYAQDIADGAQLIEVATARGLNNIPAGRASKIAERTDYWVTRAEHKLLRGEIDEAAFNSMRQESYAQGMRLMSKANLEETLKNVEYTNPRVRDMINQEFNQLNIGYNKAQSLVNDMGKITRRLWNNSMRNLNVNSFLNEMTDVINVVNRYGVSRENLANLNPMDMYDTVRRYGVGHSLNRMDNPDVAVEAMGILGSNNRKAIDGLFKAANTIDQKTALYSVAENYKAATYLKAAEDFWSARGLQGTQLRDQVLRDFDRDMIPLDHFSRVFSTDNQAIKLMTQYLDWNILHTRQQARRAIGTESSVAGRQTDMGRGGRVADNIATNILPRIGIGMARGTPIVITLGVLDPLGVASQDYSGIQDKSPLDELMSSLGISPVLGLASQFYLNWRQDEIANENYDGNPPEDSRGDWMERSLANVTKMFTPFGGQIARTGGMMDVMEDGYSENRSGRVQYLAPENPLDIVRGLVMGKGQTQPAREYSGTPDIFSMMVGDATLGELLTSNPSFEALQTFLGQENVGDYKRPVSDNDFIAGLNDDGSTMTKNFNDLIKNADSRQEQEKILQQARDYNEVLDNFRRENPRGAEAFDQVMSNDDLVNPEYWREIIGTAADGSINLDIFKMLGERKKELSKSLGIPYDPMYDLPDDQARSLLQLKSTATGDDLALRNILYKTEWYNKYVDDRNAYYNQMPEDMTVEGRRESERVKTWNTYNESLTELSLFRSPETQRQFPYHAAYKAAEAEFEDKTGKEFYGSPERDAWMANYQSGYYGEKDALNSAKLELINQMRVIEGFPPMSPEEYEQATNIADTSGGGGGRRSGGGGGGWDRNDFIGRFENNYYASTAPKVKPKQVPFKPRTSAGSRNRATARIGARSAGRDSGGYSL